MDTEESVNNKLDGLLVCLMQLNREVTFDEILEEAKKISVVSKSDELKPLLAKLVKDEHVLETPHPNYLNTKVYNLSTTGRMFEGYVIQAEKDRQEKLTFEELQLAQRVQARRLVELYEKLNDLTAWIARGTIAAAVIALLVLAFQVWVYFHPQITDVRLVK